MSADRQDEFVTTLADTVAALLLATKSRLQESQLETVRRTPDEVGSLLRAGEDVMAYESLCDNLYEDDIVAPAQLLHALRTAAREAGADLARIEALLR